MDKKPGKNYVRLMAPLERRVMGQDRSGGFDFGGNLIFEHHGVLYLDRITYIL